MNTMPVVEFNRPNPAATRNTGKVSAAETADKADFSAVLRESLDAMSAADGASAEAAKPSSESEAERVEVTEEAASANADTGQNMPLVLAGLPANLAASPSVAMAALSEGAAVHREGQVLGAQAAVMKAGTSELSVSAAVSLQQALSASQGGSAKTGLSPDGATAAVAGSTMAGTPISLASGSELGLGGESLVEVRASSVQVTQSHQAPSQVTALSMQTAADGGLVRVQLAADASSMPSEALPAEGLDPDQRLLRADGQATALLSDPSEMSFADKAHANAVLGMSFGVEKSAADLQSRPDLLAGKESLIVPELESDARAMSDMPSLTDLEPGSAVTGLTTISGPLQGTAQSAPVSPGAPTLPVMMVPATQLNGELVKFAGAGGGRAVMEITSPDLGALKIDLSIDGKGVARMVVEASSGAARDQLEQGMRKLHDDFAGMGLSLSVDLRQGSSSAFQGDGAPRQTAFSLNANDGAAVNERAAKGVPARNLADPNDKSRIHFYA